MTRRLTSIAYELGDVDLAATYAEAAVAASRGTGDLEGEAMALSNFGAARYVQGEVRDDPNYFLDSKRQYEAAVDIGRRLGSPELIATVLANLAEVTVRLGDPAGAAGLAHEGMGLAFGVGAIPATLIALVAHAEALIAMGDRATGLALLGLADRQGFVIGSTEVARIVDQLRQAGADDIDDGLAAGAALGLRHGGPGDPRLQSGASSNQDGRTSHCFTGDRPPTDSRREYGGGREMSGPIIVGVDRSPRDVGLRERQASTKWTRRPLHRLDEACEARTGGRRGERAYPATGERLPTQIGRPMGAPDGLRVRDERQRRPSASVELRHRTMPHQRRAAPHRHIRVLANRRSRTVTTGIIPVVSGHSASCVFGAHCLLVDPTARSIGLPAFACTQAASGPM